MQPQRVRVLSCQEWPSAGSESCAVLSEQSELRSVDSERTGCVIEPRNVTDRGADAVNRAEGNIGCVLLA